MTLLNAAVDGLSVVGKVDMYFHIVILTIICIILIAAIIYLIFFFEKNYVSTTATIVNTPLCKTLKNGNKETSIEVEFKANGKNVTTMIKNINNCEKLKKGDNINIKYNSSIPSVAQENTNSKTLFITIAAVILLFLLIMIYLSYRTTKSKILSASEGALLIGGETVNAL